MKLFEKISYMLIGAFLALGMVLFFTHGKDSGPTPLGKESPLQKKKKKKKKKKEKASSEKNISYQLAFYNVENLFDTVQDRSVRDDDFLPQSKKKWNTERYFKKINDVARVIHEINPKQHPVIVGLCEVENENVLRDLIKTEHLADAEYHIVHRNSADGRGIDVACLYRPSSFTLLSHTFYTFTLPDRKAPSTREIVYVKGILAKDTLHLFLNHWPSRSKGQEASEPDRIYVAGLLRQRIDSLLAINPMTRIVIMGDLNDFPTDKSVYEILGAKEPGNPQATLYNLTYNLHQEGQGTYFYKGEWGVLDHAIVSKGLSDVKKGLKAKKTAVIFSADWMLYTNKKGEQSPNRTYGGREYYGGVSDHLPIVLKLSLK